MVRCYALFFGMGSLLLGLCFCGTAHAQRFSLQAPDDATLRSTAVLSGDGLTIIDAQGTRHEYVRRRIQDSLDRRFIAFYNAQARQFIRWPVNGQGAMVIGTRRGVTIDWKPSRMQIVVAGPGNGTTRRVVGRPVALPQHFGVLAGAGGKLTVATVGDGGQLHYYQSSGDSWRHSESPQRGLLPEGAPVVLAQTAGVERVYGVGPTGDIVEITGGRTRNLAAPQGVKFISGTELASFEAGLNTHLLEDDNQGRVWEVDPKSGTFLPVDSRTGNFAAGVPLAAARGTTTDVFVVDQAGNLIGYTRGRDAWSQPYRIGAGYHSSGALSAAYIPSTPGGQPAVHLTASDGGGNLRLLRGAGSSWTQTVVDNVLLPPGAPVSLASTAEGLTVSAIQGDGTWNQWYRSAGSWAQRTIASGFVPGAPVLLHPQGLHGFAVDRSGRVVAGRYQGRRWRCALCSPKHNVAPLLEQRQIIPNPPLPPVEVLFENRYKEELVVRIFDVRRPGRPLELRIAPGSAKTQRLDRDAGATLEEVYVVAAPSGELIEEVNRFPLPPQRFYDVVVYAHKTTSVYFDRTTNKSSTPDESQKSNVSLGVFPIPPGDLVNAGERIDVYDEARRQRNPGAAAHFDTPGVPR